MKKIFIQAAFLVGAMAMLSSCLKDKGAENGEYGVDGSNSAKVVSLPQSQEGISVFALNSDPPTEDLDAVLVQLAATEVAKEDIQVTLEKDMGLVASYNNSNFTNYIELPSNCYQIVSPGGLTVTIPKGQHQAWLKVKVIKTNFDFTKAYAIGFKIGAASGGNVIAGNYRNMILAITVKNKYDGLWRMNGTLVDIANPALTAYPNAPIAFVTAGPSKVTMYNLVPTNPAWYNLPYHPIVSGGTAFSVYGDWAPEFNFNGTDNIVQVTNYYGNPAPSNTRGSALDASGINKYEIIGGIKTIRTKYIMTQSSVVPTPPSHRSFMDMTFTYVGPR